MFSFTKFHSLIFVLAVTFSTTPLNLNASIGIIYTISLTVFLLSFLLKLYLLILQPNLNDID